MPLEFRHTFDTTQMEAYTFKNLQGMVPQASQDPGLIRGRSSQTTVFWTHLLPTYG